MGRCKACCQAGMGGGSGRGSINTIRRREGRRRGNVRVKTSKEVREIEGERWGQRESERARWRSLQNSIDWMASPKAARGLPSCGGSSEMSQQRWLKNITGWARVCGATVQSHALRHKRAWNPLEWNETAVNENHACSCVASTSRGTLTHAV